MKKKFLKQTIILFLFGLGALATFYLVLTAISLAAILDGGGGSGLILRSMRNYPFAVTIIVLTISTLFTGKSASKIMMAEQ